MTIGVISDTHGLLRPEALEALSGVDHLLHAGDVGDARILDQLRELAPLTAIRGNIDKGAEWQRLLPATAAVELGGHWFYLVHAREDLDLDPAAAGISVVVFGHSHKPLIEWREGILYLNPGSAGPRRFSLPVTVARMGLSAGQLLPELVELPLPPGRK